MASTYRKRPLVPDSQRKRVRKACVRCRVNKLKCDGRQPCRRCQTGPSECLFAEKPQGRGSSPAATSIVSERETLLELILHRSGMNVPNDLRALQDYAEALESVDRATQEGQNSTAHGASRPGEPNVNNDPESVVVNHVPTPQTYVHDQGKTYFDGLFSSWAFCDSVQERVSNNTSAHRRAHKSAFRHSIIDSPNGFLSDLRPSLLAALPPQEVLGFLSDNFFKYAQSNFYIVSPEVYSRKLKAFLDGKNDFDPSASLTKRPIEFICLLFIIMAIGTQYADLEQAKPNPEINRQTVLSTSTGLLLDLVPPTPGPNPGWRFYEISRRLLADVVTSSSMTSVQACVLHGGYLVGTSAHDVAYNMHGLAVRMAINMGMHKSVSSDMLHPLVLELRNRLWWSVYTRDWLFTFQMGRPLTIEDDEIDTPYPTHVAELVVDQFGSPVGNQVALIDLCKLLGKVIKTIYSSFGSAPSNSRVINTSQFLALKSELQQWKLELPEGLRISPSSSRGVFHLHLTHEQTIILLNRLPLTHAAATVENGTNDLQPNKMEFLTTAAKCCVAAAITTIKILRFLRESKLMCRYACQDSLYCSAALHVLLLGARLGPPTDDFKGIIADGIYMLRELAEGNETAASAIEGITTGFNRLFKTQTLQPSPTSTNPGDLADCRTMGSRAWEKWMAENSATATSSDRVYTSRPLDRDASNTSPSTGDAFSTYLANAIQPDSSSQGLVTDTNYPQNDMISPSNFNLSASQFSMAAFGDYPITNQPLWFPELDKGFSLLDGGLGEGPMTEGFDIWDSVAPELFETDFL